MTEAVPGTFKVDVETLNTLRRFEYSPDDGIGGALTTAHPVIDPDGTVYNIYVDVRRFPARTPNRFLTAHS